MTARRALFLDKDGVINVNHGYVCTPERTDFIGSAFELCRAATQHGFLNVVVTNQAGIGRGYYSESDFTTYVDWVRAQFRERGAQLDAFYYCPHHPEHGIGKYLRDCACRKPKPGMLLDAKRDLDLELSRSVLVGDSASDLEAGRAAGVRDCIQVRVVQPPGAPAMLDAGGMQQVLRALARTD